KTKCETCMANMADCPGHFGHLELAKPMFHIRFMKTVLSIMRWKSVTCARLKHNSSKMIESSLEPKLLPPEWPMPVNLKRIIWNAQKTFKVDLRQTSDMHPSEIIGAVDKLQERLRSLVALGEMIGCVAA
nr:DNA-directed RNA polymerase II subunit 1 [Tanacetum cinerariifolium]